MFRLIQFFILLLIISYGNTMLAQDNANQEVWTIYDDGRYTISSFEAKEHIELVYLSEEQKIRLFNEAQRNFQNYNDAKNEWINNRLLAAVKELSFYKLVERIANIEYQNLGYYIAFQNATDLRKRTIRNDLFESLQNEIKSRVYQDQEGLNRQQKNQLKIEFANNLIERGYPHQSSATPAQVYQQWYANRIEKLEKTVELELIAEAMEEFEQYLQSLGFRPRFFSPIVINERYQEASELLERWQTEQSTISDTRRFLEANPDVNALIIDYYPESPRYLEVEKLQEKYPERMQEVKEILNSNIAGIINQDLKRESLTASNIALNMLADNLSDEELEEGKEVTLNQYQETGEYPLLLTSRAFDLALSLRGNEDKLQQSISEVILPKIDEIYQNLETAFENEIFFQGTYSRLPIAESVRSFAATFIDSDSLQPYENKIMSAFLWLVKLKMENLFADFANETVFEMRPANEAKIDIESVMRREEVNRIRREGIQNYTDTLFISIWPTPESKISGQEIFDFLFTTN